MPPDAPHDYIASFDTAHTMNEAPTKHLPRMEGTPQDQDDMTRMGKIQQLKVLFAFFWCDMKSSD
jgi:hypothetical protein